MILLTRLRTPLWSNSQGTGCDRMKALDLSSSMLSCIRAVPWRCYILYPKYHLYVSRYLTSFMIQRATEKLLEN